MPKSASTLENLCKPPKIIALQPRLLLQGHLLMSANKRDLYTFYLASIITCRYEIFYHFPCLHLRNSGGATPFLNSGDYISDFFLSNIIERLNKEICRHTRAYLKTAIFIFFPKNSCKSDFSDTPY